MQEGGSFTEDPRCRSSLASLLHLLPYYDSEQETLRRSAPGPGLGYGFDQEQ